MIDFFFLIAMYGVGELFVSGVIPDTAGDVVTNMSFFVS